MKDGATAGPGRNHSGSTGNGVPTIRPEEEATGFPGLRTWRDVYVLVLILFALYVVLLIALERKFS